MADERDRLPILRDSSDFNGIDFVTVGPGSPPPLHVHFVNQVALGDTGPIVRISGGDRIPGVEVEPVTAADWTTDAEGSPLLRVHPLIEGDFSNYTLSLAIPKLDRFYASSQFSFKIRCPSDFDCADEEPDCLPDEGDLPPIDYTAKDYSSYRRALSEFSALRYPQWEERSEADLGMTLLESFAAIADDLSYYQDRVAAEATLDSATQRQSVISHARLVDYEPAPELAARVTVICWARGAADVAGALITARTPLGDAVPFEIGEGLDDRAPRPVDPRWNEVAPYWLDNSRRCLEPGSSELWVIDHGLGLTKGQVLVIESHVPGQPDQPRREQVRIGDEPEEWQDALFPDPGSPPTPARVTRIPFEGPTILQHDLEGAKIYGNVHPATQGRRHSETFAIARAPAEAPGSPIAFPRVGAHMEGQRRIDYRYPLGAAPLAWQPDSYGGFRPEITLRALDPAEPWEWRRSFVAAAALVAESDRVFTLDAASYRAIGRDRFHFEYDHDRGTTIRFGNGALGMLPEEECLFTVTYRAGAGADGNLAADSAFMIESPHTAVLTRVVTAFPGEGGADRETDDQVRQRAPNAFRARQFRAVRVEDYETEVERLPWVQQAGTAFRWTGSWLTVFTAVDPREGAELPLSQRMEATNLVNRRRLTGYETYVVAPRYVSIDLRIVLCARPDVYEGHVKEAVLEALGATRAPSGRAGFFFADRFTFGTPLERSRLEAALQQLPGVTGVESIEYRRRGVVPGYTDLQDTFTLAVDEVLRIDNDPDHPERGVIKVIVKGGR